MLRYLFLKRNICCLDYRNVIRGMRSSLVDSMPSKREVSVQVHSFLNSARGGDESLVLCPGRFTFVEQPAAPVD